MKRPIAALVMAAVLLLSMPMVSAVSLSVSGLPGSIRAGETFTVTVELGAGAEFCAAQFTLAFDRDEMECTEVSPGPLLEGMMHAENPAAESGAIVAAASATPVTSGNGGVLASYRFTAKTDLTNPRLALKAVRLSDENGKNLDVSLTVNADPDTSATPEETGNPGPAETPEVSGNTPEPGTSAQPPEPPEREPVLPSVPSFSDIDGHWAAESIRSAASRGIISGYADGTFRPNQPVTRKQMAVILWRMAGKPQPASPAPFTDLGGCGEEFRNAIAWGYGTKLLSGTSSTTFSPDAALTRQAAMKLLFGYAGGQAGSEALLYTTYDGTYADSAQLSGWAREPVYWGVYNGILSGNGNSLNPRGTVTRAQLAAILTRYLDRGDI